MTVLQFLVTAVISILVTLPAVLFIPRARQSPAFDSILWIGTAALAFLCASFVVNNINLPALNGLVLGDVVVIPALLGAAVGAFALNGLLWLMDLSNRGKMEDNLAFDDTSRDQPSTPTVANEESSSGSGTENPN